MAPITDTAEDELYFEGSGDNDDIQEQLYQLLKDALLNDTENVEKINDRFNQTQILCVGVRYIITCTEEEICDNETSTLNCSTGYNSERVWLSFDPNTTSGRYLFRYAVLNWEVLGLTWQGACDLSEEAYLTLNIHVRSLTPLLCGVDAEKYINSSLRELTEQVRTANGRVSKATVRSLLYIQHNKHLLDICLLHA